jgi:hypothetical protein
MLGMTYYAANSCCRQESVKHASINLVTKLAHEPDFELDLSSMKLVFLLAELKVHSPVSQMSTAYPTSEKMLVTGMIGYSIEQKTHRECRASASALP